MKTRKGLTFEDVVRLHIKNGFDFCDVELEAFDIDDWGIVSEQYEQSSPRYEHFLKGDIIEPNYSDWIGKLCVFWDDEIDLNNWSVVTNYLKSINDDMFVANSGGSYQYCMLLEDFIKEYGEKMKITKREVKKLIKELKDEFDYFNELKSQENTADGAMQWQIKMIKREFAIDMLNLLIE